MLPLFRYNWQVRSEWFEWRKQVPTEELRRERVGGVGSILHTLFRIVDVELLIYDLAENTRYFRYECSRLRMWRSFWHVEHPTFYYEKLTRWLPDVLNYSCTDCSLKTEHMGLWQERLCHVKCSSTYALSH